MNNNAIRTRWSAIGAAVAITLGAGGIGLVSATSPADAVAYVPIEPCRIADTRPEPAFNVGPRSTPIGQNETHVITGHGDNGDCTGIPTTATGLQLNVTAVNASQNTFVTVWGEGDRPNASSLNPALGQPPAPNAVTTGLSATGTFNVYNRFGTVDVIADVVGYYTDHNHDDRYYTETEADAAHATKANAADVYTKADVDAQFAALPPQPIAMGRVSSSGVFGVGFGVDNVTWDPVSEWYEIELTGINYFGPNFVTVVTPSCPSSVEPMLSAGSVSGDLLVIIWDDSPSADDVPVQCSFSFITYQP